MTALTWLCGLFLFTVKHSSPSYMARRQVCFYKFIGTVFLALSQHWNINWVFKFGKYIMTLFVYTVAVGLQGHLIILMLCNRPSQAVVDGQWVFGWPQNLNQFTGALTILLMTDTMANLVSKQFPSCIYAGGSYRSTPTRSRQTDVFNISTWKTVNSAAWASTLSNRYANCAF
jgi:hypothetical protein